MSVWRPSPQKTAKPRERVDNWGLGVGHQRGVQRQGGGVEVHHAGPGPDQSVGNGRVVGFRASGHGGRDEAGVREVVAVRGAPQPVRDK